MGDPKLQYNSRLPWRIHITCRFMSTRECTPVSRLPSGVFTEYALTNGSGLGTPG